MIRIAKADGVSERELINQLKARSGEIDRKVTSAVTDILNNVKQNGDDAVREYTLKFDGHMPSKFEISCEEIDSSPDKCDRDLYLLFTKRQTIYVISMPVRNSRAGLSQSKTA